MPKALPMRIVAGLALLVSLVVNFGVIDLATAIAPSPECWGITVERTLAALAALAVAPAGISAAQMASHHRAPSWPSRRRSSRAPPVSRGRAGARRGRRPPASAAAP